MRTILTLSAINTSNSIFCLVALFIILRARNGAVLAVQRLIPVSRWDAGQVPEHFPCLLAGLLVASTAALFITAWLGALFASRIQQMNYERIVKGIILFIIVMVAVFNGPVGLLVLAVSTSVGLLAPSMGIRY